MTTDRSYRTAMSLGEAVDELRRNAGTQFSPGVVDALISILQADPLVVGARGPRVAAVA
jgi:HD-GYP domain-containing protein (c-di-GMP phosphodiesterase class II)